MERNTIGRPMEILLVEDSLTSARSTMGALKNGKVQHRLTWVTNGHEALQFVRQEAKFNRAPRPDLILLDLDLPKLDGREVLKAIRADANLMEIPVVILTGSTAQEDRLQSEELQVESYLTKPVNIEKFLAVVAKLSRFWRADMILPTTSGTAL